MIDRLVYYVQIFVRCKFIVFCSFIFEDHLLSQFVLFVYYHCGYNFLNDKLPMKTVKFTSLKICTYASYPPQVSHTEYTDQMKETSHVAIVSLLDEISSSRTLSHTKKKQLLKKVCISVIMVTCDHMTSR